jgi:hypothetical protein
VLKICKREKQTKTRKKELTGILMREGNITGERGKTTLERKEK